MTTKVLIIEDDVALRASIAQTLELEDLEPIPMGSFNQARRAIRSNFNGVILSDIKMPDHDGFDVLRFAQRLDADLPVVLLTGHSDVPTAMRAIREGAYDYLEKPCETTTLVDTLRRALDHRNLVLDNRSLARQLDRGDIAALNFPGKSEVSRALRQSLRECAGIVTPVHIWGETGVGKRTAAFVVHSLAEDDRDFTAINCENAKPNDLAHIDLSQPFTLSVKNLHSAGPILCDAITSTVSTASELRLITTAKCGFADLNLNWETPHPIEIHVPSLIERATDIRVIFETCLRHAARATGTDMPVPSRDTIQHLFDHQWTGNLSELRNFAANVLEGQDDAEPTKLSERIENYEKSAIFDTLHSCSGSVSQAAKKLGLPRNTLYDRMARFGLVARDFRRN